MVEKFPTPLKGVPLGELAANVVSRLRGYPRSGAANAVSRHDPAREKGVLKSPQAFQNPKI